MKILLIEDNIELAHSLVQLLKKANYVLEHATTGEEAIALLISERYDIILLDLLLPGIKGSDLLKKIRSKDPNIPILIVSANHDPHSIVKNLDLGADDYITKPFKIEELEARIRTKIRRSNSSNKPIIICGFLSYDTNTKIFKNNDTPIEFTPREHSVLELLIMKIGKTISKQSLIDGVYSIDQSVSFSALEIYILRIRKKIQGTNAQIITLRGLGYMLSHVAENESFL